MTPKITEINYRINPATNGFVLTKNWLETSNDANERPYETYKSEDTVFTDWNSISDFIKVNALEVTIKE